MGGRKGDCSIDGLKLPLESGTKWSVRYILRQQKHGAGILHITQTIYLSEMSFLPPQKKMYIALQF